MPVQALWATAVAAALWLVLNRHRFGEHLLFIGDNVSVARVVGVNVGREKIKLFTLMGVLGAFAAVLLTAENKNFFNTQGSGFLLTVMAAVFIGGTSIFGGKATIVGSYVGAYIIGMIEAGLVATGMQGFWVRAVVGLVFLAAVIFHLTMEDPTRLRRLRHLHLPGRFQRRPTPPARSRPTAQRSDALTRPSPARGEADDGGRRDGYPLVGGLGWGEWQERDRDIGRKLDPEPAGADRDRSPCRSAPRGDRQAADPVALDQARDQA